MTNCGTFVVAESGGDDGDDQPDAGGDGPLGRLEAWVRENPRLAAGAGGVAALGLLASTGGEGERRITRLRGGGRR